MGKDQLDESALQTVKRFLANSKRKEFEKNIKFAPQWIRTILLDLMKDEI